MRVSPREAHSDGYGQAVGLFQRAANRSQERVWSSVVTEHGEQRIDYAHLVAAFDHADRPGTAFLTDRRFAWVTPQGGVGLNFWLTDCAGWARPKARPNQPGLVVVFPPAPGEEPAPLVLYAQQPRSAANRHLAARFFESVISQLAVVHPDW